jgi:flagellar biosynthesis regulator FlbT
MKRQIAGEMVDILFKDEQENFSSEMSKFDEKSIDQIIEMFRDMVNSFESRFQNSIIIDETECLLAEINKTLDAMIAEEKSNES